MVLGTVIIQKVSAQFLYLVNPGYLQYLHEAVVVELVVAGQGDETAPARR